MKSLRARLEALELASRLVSGSEQLNLLFAAMGGDRAAAAQFEQLRSRGALAGRLGELYDALTYPFDPERTGE